MTALNREAGQLGEFGAPNENEPAEPVTPEPDDTPDEPDDQPAPAPVPEQQPAEVQT